jgi:hypothetical protein
MGRSLQKVACLAVVVVWWYHTVWMYLGSFAAETELQKPERHKGG